MVAGVHLGGCSPPPLEIHVVYTKVRSFAPPLKIPQHLFCPPPPLYKILNAPLGRIKNYTNEGSSDNNRQDAPYIFQAMEFLCKIM